VFGGGGGGGGGGVLVVGVRLLWHSYCCAVVSLAFLLRRCCIAPEVELWCDTNTQKFLFCLFHQAYVKEKPAIDA